jgi:hypothetical protein
LIRRLWCLVRGPLVLDIARGELVEPRARKLILRPFERLRVALSNVEGRQAQDERVRRSVRFATPKIA